MTPPRGLHLPAIADDEHLDGFLRHLADGDTETQVRLLTAEIRHTADYLRWLKETRGRRVTDWYMGPDRPTLARIARYVGVTDSYLSRWLRDRGIRRPEPPAPPHD